MASSNCCTVYKVYDTAWSQQMANSWISQQTKNFQQVALHSICATLIKLSKYEQQSSLVVTLLWIFFTAVNGCNIRPNMAECNPRFYTLCHGGNRNSTANKFLKTNFFKNLSNGERERRPHPLIYQRCDMKSFS